MINVRNLFPWIRALGSSSARLGVALTMAFTVTALIGVGCYWGWTYSDRIQAKKAEVTKTWTKDLLSNLSMNLQAKTKLVEGKMYVYLGFEGYPDYLKKFSNQDRGFYIRWEDVDGFVHLEKFLKVSDFSTNIDEKGDKSGLSIQYTQFISPNEYAKLKAVSVVWSVDTAVAKAVSPAAAFGRNDGLVTSDHCAPGLSRQERMRRLGRNGQTRETGLGEFKAGLHSITFMHSGEVLSCR